MAEDQASQEAVGAELPLFVQYLSEPDTPYDCWFKVQDPDKPEDPPETIGGSKLHLMAHSVVFRKMLHESPLAEKGPITIPDVSPSTFRHLLKFFHGHFDVTYLTMNEAVALLYASEKYFVDFLQPRLKAHIASLLSVDNIFLLMMKQEIFQDENFEKAMQKIIQEETRKLVAKNEFLELSTAGILSIVTQEILQTSEIELWRAVLRWAKHQGGTDRTEDLREVLTEPLKHMRFCTLDFKEFIKEVSSTGILTDSEVLTVVQILGGALSPNTLSDENDISALNSLSYSKTARSLFLEEELEIQFSGPSRDKTCYYSQFYLTTEEKSVQLLSVVLPDVKNSTGDLLWGAPKK